jgi:hypothetical protein
MALNGAGRHALYRRCFFDADGLAVYQPGCDGLQPLVITSPQGDQPLSIQRDPDATLIAVRLQRNSWHQRFPPQIVRDGGSYATQLPIC